MVRFFAFYFLFLISACTSTPKIVLQPLPISVTEKIPVHVALIMDNEFRNYQYTGPLAAYSATEPVQGTESFKIHYSLGELNVDLFNHVANSLFMKVTVFDTRETMMASGISFDGVMIPSISTFNTWLQNPNIGAGITSNLSYKILFFNNKNQQILDWTVDSHQTKCINGKFCGNSQREEIILVVRRDIAGQIITQFSMLPEVIAWKESIAVRP